MPKYKQSFTRRLVALISEPDFIRFENMLGEPNIFRVVGRSHYERWHSCFWGWLLDPTGSHLLSNYVFIRMLSLLWDERTLKPNGPVEEAFFASLPTLDFAGVEVTPNEYNSTERSVSGIGRFDIFASGQYVDDSGKAGKINIVFELKIDSKADPEQSRKYADWLHSTHPAETNILIYVTPALKDNSKETCGDGRWFCLDYQLLNDKLLLTLLDHPALNSKVEPFIVQYVKNLRTRYKGIKMAITEQEKRMAQTLYEKYSDVFDSIYDALVAIGTIDYTTTGMTAGVGRASGLIAVKLDGKVFRSPFVKDLFSEILKYLVEKDYLKKLPLPWGTGTQRYVITNEYPPKHPNGRDFFYPVSNSGFYLETHYARDRALKVLGDLAGKLDLTFELIET